jgi:hypothetical protein
VGVVIWLNLLVNLVLKNHIRLLIRVIHIQNKILKDIILHELLLLIICLHGQLLLTLNLWSLKILLEVLALNRVRPSGSVVSVKGITVAI